MQTTRRLVPLMTALIGLTLLSLSSVAHAQETSVPASFANPPKDAIAINVLVGQSRVINFDRKIGRFSVSNPDVAEAVLVAPDQVLVNGKAFGQVNFIAWEKDTGKFLVFDVFVRANLSLIDSQIRALFPKDDIRLSQANGSVVISGSVTNPVVAQQAEQVVKAAGFQTVNMLASPVKNVAQVQLQVRVAEVNRSRMKDLGTSYAYQGANGTGGYMNSGSGPSSLGDVIGGAMSGTFTNALNLFVMGGNTMGMIRAMQTQGALRLLAEPNLVAMDGQQASFLAGGEFPVPVVQHTGGSNRASITVMFKEYGVRLNFKPTIIDEDHIRLELEPEVSTIDFANGVKVDGFVIPGLSTRRAKTGLELRDGQSFALAGLLDNTENRSLSKVPIAGDIPVIGALFKSKSYMKQETELVFIMTAQLVKPVSPDDLPRLRGLDGLQNGSPLGVEPKGEGINGASGYSTGDATGSANAHAPSTTTPTTTTPATTTPATAPAKGETKEAPKSDAPKTDAPKVEATKTGSSNKVAQLPVRDHAADLLPLMPGVARVAPPPNQH
ncbi:MAG: type II and III secretion system protein family protein [Pyrinomonadaceae bacterium]